MKEPVGEEKLAAASISLGDKVGKIEKFLINETGQEQIRFSLWSQGEMLPQPLHLTEKELIALLQAAIGEGILSPDLLGELQAITDI